MMDKVLDIKEAARILNVSKDTVRREIKAGKIKAAKVRRSVRIEPEDLELYLAKQRIKVESEKPKQTRRKPPPVMAAHEAAMERLRRAGAVS